MKSEALVSVIIPCFNSEKWIEFTLDSVSQQSYKNIEIIIVDDGSTDDTGTIINNYSSEIKYIYKNNEGPSAARNTGLKIAKGEYIAFLDSDDLWDHEKVKKQVDYMDNHKEIALVFNNVNVINEENKIQYITNKKVPINKNELIRDLYLGKIGMNTPTIMIRSSVLEEVTGFEESLKRREDHYLMMEIADKFPVYFMEDSLTSVRVNSKSISRTTKPDELLELYSPFLEKTVEKFPFLKEYKNTAYSRIYNSISRGCWKLDNKKDALKYIIKSISLRPLFPLNYILIILYILGIKSKDVQKIKASLSRIKTIAI
jgi:glycosyltransferase involved in cell wall biosynthesis